MKGNVCDALSYRRLCQWQLFIQLATANQPPLK
jgi:hypothetical protein